MSVHSLSHRQCQCLDWHPNRTGLFRGLTPSREFAISLCSRIPQLIARSHPKVIRLRHHLHSDPNHPSSIPAAGSTFAAFELTRGEFEAPLADERVIDIPSQNICENLLVYDPLAVKTAPAKIRSSGCYSRSCASLREKHVLASSLAVYACTVTRPPLLYCP